MARFRYYKSIPLSYERQGLIWFTCKNYKTQPKGVQLKILRACERAGRHNCAALFEYLTTGKSMNEIMRRHYIASETTMYHMIREFYQIVEI